MSLVGEFLASIRFSVNDRSEKDLEKSILKATLAANLLAETLVRVAKEVSAFVANLAVGGEQLYYSSQRVGASVENIRGFSYAVSQLGGSTDAAMASLENFGKALRTNPGYESMVQALGVKTRDAQGRMIDRVQVLNDVARSLSRRPYYIAQQYAQSLGLDEPTFMAMLKGIGDYDREFKRVATSVGLNSEVAAERSRDFMRAQRSLSMVIQVVATKLASDLMPSMTEWTRRLNDWLVNNVDRIQSGLLYLIDSLVQFAMAVRAVIEAMTPAIVAFEKASNALLNSNGLNVALGLLLGLFLTSWVARVVGAFVAVRRGWVGLLAVFGVGVAGYLGFGGSEASANTGSGGTNPAGGSGGGSSGGGSSASGGGIGGAIRGTWDSVKRFFGGGSGGASSGSLANSFNKGTWPGLPGGDAKPPSVSENPRLTSGVTKDQLAGVDRRLVDIVAEASKYLPEGYTAKVISGLRVTSGATAGRSYHDKGLAIDLQIYDEKGKPVPNYQDAPGFRTYEQLAQVAKKIQTQRYPGLPLAWGGYFWSGGPGRYGNMDSMHFSLGESMGAGSFENGLNAMGKAPYPGAKSVPMGDPALFKLPEKQTETARLGEASAGEKEKAREAILRSPANPFGLHRLGGGGASRPPTVINQTNNIDVPDVPNAENAIAQSLSGINRDLAKDVKKAVN